MIFGKSWPVGYKNNQSSTKTQMVENDLDRGVVSSKKTLKSDEYRAA